MQGVMRGMLTQDAASRPAVKAVVEAGYFKDDRMLRALRFIDTILQRETAQKHAFVRDLPTFLPQFPIRILRLRVLPCLIQQWHDSALRDAVLPLVLRMVKNLPADIFQEQVWPVGPTCASVPDQRGRSHGPGSVVAGHARLRCPTLDTTTCARGRRGYNGLMAVPGHAGPPGAQGHPCERIRSPGHAGAPRGPGPATGYACRPGRGRSHACDAQGSR